MPELPEVETIRRYLATHLVGQTIRRALLYTKALRRPIPALNRILPHLVVSEVRRLGKYLLICFDQGTLIMHFGMSGRLHWIQNNAKRSKHDHLDMVLSDNSRLRYNDPRRFGMLLWYVGAINQHPIFAKLGPEPLSQQVTARYLYCLASFKRTAIKLLLLNQDFIAGIGNIYASEILFRARIHPARLANNITYAEWILLVRAIKQVLKSAIQAGGSSIKSFISVNGQLGAFQSQHAVYARTSQPCTICSTPIEALLQGQRISFYCPYCQILSSVDYAG